MIWNSQNTWSQTTIYSYMVGNGIFGLFINVFITKSQISYLNGLIEIYRGLFMTKSDVCQIFKYSGIHQIFKLMWG